MATSNITVNITGIDELTQLVERLEVSVAQLQAMRDEDAERNHLNAELARLQGEMNRRDRSRAASEGVPFVGNQSRRLCQ